MWERENKKVQSEDKNVVALPLGTVATVLGKMLYELCKKYCRKKSRAVDDWDKIKLKKKKSDEQYLLNKSKVL